MCGVLHPSLSSGRVQFSAAGKRLNSISCKTRDLNYRISFSSCKLLQRNAKIKNEKIPTGLYKNCHNLPKPVCCF